MRLRRGVLRLLGVAIVLLAGQASAWADSTLTQTLSINPAFSPPNDLVQTNFGPGTAGISDPLIFNKLSPSVGTLNSIDITLTSQIRNDYIMNFTTPSTITLTTSPDPINHPDSGGPNVSLLSSDGTTPIFGPPATSQPPDIRSVTSSNSTFSSLISPGSPNFLPPTITAPSFTRTLTAPNNGALFSQFIGSGTLGLPVIATANSSFFSNTGNGGGTVLTKADALVTLTYHYTPAVPEPSSLVLLGLGGTSLFVLSRRRRRADAP